MKRDIAIRQAPLPEKRFEVWDMPDTLAYALESGNSNVPEEIKELARLRLATMRPLLPPVTIDELRTWFLPVIANCREGKVSDIEGWLKLMHRSVDNIPRGIFTLAKQQWAMRETRFLPMSADLWDMIKHDWTQLNGHRESLERLISE